MSPLGCCHCGLIHTPTPQPCPSCDSNFALYFYNPTKCVCKQQPNIPISWLWLGIKNVKEKFQENNNMDNQRERTNDNALLPEDCIIVEKKI
jgi:hypothetical protein